MAVTAVMHLLFLVAFSWMLVEGLLLWSRVVAVSMRPGPRMRLYYATGWGEAPLPPPLLWSPRLCLAWPLPQHRLPHTCHRPTPTSTGPQHPAQQPSPTQTQLLSSINLRLYPPPILEPLPLQLPPLPASGAASLTCDPLTPMAIASRPLC